MTVAVKPEPAFRLDEDRARRWLTALVEYHDGADLPDEYTDYEAFVDADWNPPREEVAEASVWSSLPHYAQELGVVVGPYEVLLLVEPDCYYRTAVAVPTDPGSWPGHYLVAGMGDELHHLGDPDARGVEAAIALLADMVAAANQLVNAAGLSGVTADTSSSASRQHFIDAGRYLTTGAPELVRLREFVRQVANLTKDGEPTDSGEEFVMENDDNWQTLMGLISEARDLLGMPADRAKG